MTGETCAVTRRQRPGCHSALWLANIRRHHSIVESILLIILLIFGSALTEQCRDGRLQVTACPASLGETTCVNTGFGSFDRVTDLQNATRTFLYCACR